ncbi:hypothetical protein B2D07_14350 [Desulfococcus multivorans]|nr:uncharacterized protein Dmul_28710 [Desulfococcus multivorans]AQV01830.1 hypothetical protein B2D07_14350 [Desulfococcus multivorans]
MFSPYLYESRKLSKKNMTISGKNVNMDVGDWKIKVKEKIFIRGKHARSGQYDFLGGKDWVINEHHVSEGR